MTHYDMDQTAVSFVLETSRPPYTRLLILSAVSKHVRYLIRHTGYLRHNETRVQDYSQISIFFIILNLNIILMSEL